MAGDWIKMRLSLVAHPKVMRIAEVLLNDGDYWDWAGLTYGVPSFPASTEEENKRNRYGALRVTRYVTVCALLRFWGYANEHAKDDESIAGLWPDDVDEISGVPGFCAALEAVGWIAFDRENGLARLPNFKEHNVLGRSGATNAERQRRYRERKKLGESNGISNGKSNVTRDVTSNEREEKRREEKNKEIKPIASGDKSPSAAKAVNGNAVAYIPLNDGSEFGVSAELLAELENLYPAVDAKQTLNEIRGWNLANPSRRKTKAGVVRHINQWFAKEQNRG